MRINRRTLLKNGSLVAGIVATTGAGRAFEGPAIIIYDSRDLKSRAFAYRKPGPKIDVAQEDVQMWRSLRTINKRRVEGLTIWSDWVLVRGLLEEKGLRVKQEAKIGSLFRWTMV